jgi:hypothetical protein
VTRARRRSDDQRDPAWRPPALTAYEQAMFVRGANVADLVLCFGEEAPQSLVDMFAGTG